MDVLTGEAARVQHRQPTRGVLLACEEMNRLLQIGFVPAGHWHLDGERVRFELTRHATERNILTPSCATGR
jgi:hypothetical protein